jgi:hypothetical protein
MINLSKTSRLGREEVLKKAIDFFGPGGQGLEVREESPGCVSFEGGGGSVTVTANPDGKNTSIEVSSQEWDIQAREFITGLK